MDRAADFESARGGSTPPGAISSISRGVDKQGSTSPLTRAERLDDERLVAVAGTHGKTPAQVLLRWNLQLGVVPLPKANRREHLAENADVFDFELDEAELDELGRLDERWSALGESLQYG